MTRKKLGVAVLGGGITGLSAALMLQKEGIEATVFEKKEQVGGLIQSRQTDGWLTELGPNTLMVRDQKVWDLLDDLGLDTEVLEANSEAARRYILKEGELMPLPSSPLSFVRTELLSASAKFRLLKEPFISAGEKEDENISNFISRRLGKEVLDYAVNPFVAGIFAGDPDQLSIKHTFSKLHELEQTYGSLLKGMLKQGKKNSARKALISFKEGLQSLPLAISDKLGNRLHTNREVTELNYTGGRWQLHFRDGSLSEHDAIIATIPIQALQKLITAEEAQPSLYRSLNKIFYAPMSVIHLGYREEQLGHPLDGFGMLIPEKEQRKLLGTLFSSTLFPGRAPDGHALLTNFIGGAREPGLTHQAGSDLIELIKKELTPLLDIKGEPVFTSHTRWDKAIPQYEMGYDQQLEAMKQLEQHLPGLYLCGAYRGGVSVPDCISNGMQKAGEVASQLSR